MFSIIAANFGFWFNFLIPVAIALFLVFTHKEYIWKEFGIQVGVTFAYVAIIYTLLFSVTTDLLDENYYNGKVASSTYYEEWKEEVTYTESYSCGTSKNPRTCTRTKKRIDYHAPYYQIKTNLGESIRISRGDYLKSKREFGAKYVDIRRFDQVSYGDGDKYVSYPTKSIPTSVGHTYENIVAAANGNVIHTKVPKETLAQLVKTGKVRDYPVQYKGAYGETLLNRVINTTSSSTKNWLETLNQVSSNVGKLKQANPIIYLTNEDRSIKDAISQHWKMGKKNDVTLILGVDANGEIQWSDVITFTNNTDFIVDMQNDFTGKKITDIKYIFETFNNGIVNSYVRKPMKEFEYLKENITLEWYYQLLILIGNIALSGFVTWKFLNNWERKR